MDAPPRFTPARAVATFAVALGFFLLVVELGGAAFFYLEHRRLVWLNDVPRAAAPPTGEETYKQRLHPYFGFTGPYSAKFRTGGPTAYTNSLGFFQREPLALPFARGDKDFVVAVFGGSVAANLVQAPRGGTTLGEALARLPALSDRRVVVVDMAQGSGKEPQQLLELAYLLALGQRLDLAIALDGFNELALGLQNWQSGLDPILPAGLIIGALAQEVMPATAASVEYYEIAFRVSEAKRDLERHEAGARASRFGLAYLANRARATLDRMTLGKYLERYNHAIGASGDVLARWKMLGLDLPVDAAQPDKVPALLELWLRSSRQLGLLAGANGIGFLHIVQPNQYYSGKAFTDDEKKIALSLPPGHEFRVAVAEGYRRLEAEPHPELVSAIHLYDAETADIYADNCCHVNARGETILAEFVAARVEDWLKRASR